MSLSSYTVYVDTNAVSVSIDPTANLATLRTQLGSNINGTDVFLYFNPVTSQKTVLPMTSEDKVPVSDILFPPVAGSGNQIIEVVSNAAGSPSFLGSTTQSGYLNTSPYFGVQVVLNQSDAAAITNNAGMFQPLMLENVQSCDPNQPAFFSNAVICQQGAIIQFNISCWGAAGWGFTITSTMNTSTDINAGGLFIPYRNGNYNSMMTTSLLRYNSQAGDTIQIEANAALGIASQYNVQYSTVTVNAWSLSSWIDSEGNNYASSAPIPSTSAAEMELLTLGAKDGFQPPPPGGTTSIPGGTTQPAAPTAGPPSGQTFGTFGGATPGSPPNTRAGGLVGSIELFFLVFNSQADAQAVIKVLNSSETGFGNG
jgi:hypothetical protein